VQQIFRTTAFMAETCVFAYLGMAIFSFKHQFRPAFVIWTIVSNIVCLLVVYNAVITFTLFFEFYFTF